MRKQSMADIYTNLQDKETWLLEKANVVGCGIGEKIKAGLPLGRICLKVYVEIKLPLNKLAKHDIIPQAVSLIETDVEEIGKIKALGFTGRYRPALGGSSIGHYQITAGTLGCLVKDKATHEILILSNNHVLANSNEAKKGDSILQPGPYDGGKKAKDTIGTLERWVEIKFGKEANLIDAALARPKSQKLVKPEIMEIGAPLGTIKPKLGMLIQKSGRTTGYTAGKIKDISATIKINYDQKVALFKNQILTTNMSQGGDSGSLVLDMKKRAIGLLFAGSDVVTIMNPVLEVIRLLNVVPYSIVSEKVEE
ncbi:MAG TPA: hypothetical protein DCL49_08010 [Candidatus Omnitrophica bacterium]|nr:hypothetical protein [Candidatus Omnitrophota bacterium]HBG64496.1 hypothetical protein [Candidatus Omnitrophota bacterium]HCD38307.1 hypothetical protein [Candidatus Omnitrophota bacterium]